MYLTRRWAGGGLHRCLDLPIPARAHPAKVQVGVLAESRRVPKASRAGATVFLDAVHLHRARGDAPRGRDRSPAVPSAHQIPHARTRPHARPVVSNFTHDRSAVLRQASQRNTERGGAGTGRRPPLLVPRVAASPHTDIARLAPRVRSCQQTTGRGVVIPLLGVCRSKKMEAM
jgi:hypothetical protein